MSAMLTLLSLNHFSTALSAEPAGSPEQGSITAYKRMSLEELMNMDVTSVSRRAEPYTHAPAAIQVVTSEDIRRSGATSIPEALRLADNLHVAQKNAHDWAISARGFNTELANKMLVLIDGRAVYTPLFSGVFWDRQDYLLEDLDRIEVISGPGGTLWGANAVNGVINIITKGSKETQGLYIEGGGGTQPRGFGGVRYGTMISSNTALRVYGKYFDRDNEEFIGGSKANDSWWMGQGGFRADSEFSDGNTFTLQGDYYGGEERITTGGDAEVSGGNILGRWTRQFSDESDMRLQLYYDKTYLSLPVPASVANGVELAPAGTLVDTLDTYDIDFQHRFSVLERNRLVWGIGYRFTHNEADNAPALAFLPAELERSLFSGFIQDEIRVLENVFITLGTKIEHNDYTGFEFEPNVRAQWNVASNHMIWAAVSRAVRTPSRVERHERLPTPNLSPVIENLLVGNGGFDSESVLAYEIGYRSQLHPRLFTSVSAFYNDYDDLRSTSPSPPPAPLGFPFMFRNDLEGETYGVEFSLTYQVLDWWRVRGGYTFLGEDIRLKDGRVDINNALNETADSRHRWSLRSSMDFGHDVELDAGLRWVDTLRFNNNGTAGEVSDYLELEVRLAWRPTEHLELSIAGQNLLHERHAEYATSNPAAREEITRSIYAKVALDF